MDKIHVPLCTNIAAICIAAKLYAIKKLCMHVNPARTCTICLCAVESTSPESIVSKLSSPLLLIRCLVTEDSRVSEVACEEQVAVSDMSTTRKDRQKCYRREQGSRCSPLMPSTTARQPAYTDSCTGSRRGTA